MVLHFPTTRGSSQHGKAHHLLRNGLEPTRQTVYTTAAGWMELGTFV
jgi:hypothetical protein